MAKKKEVIEIWLDPNDEINDIARRFRVNKKKEEPQPEPQKGLLNKLFGKKEVIEEFQEETIEDLMEMNQDYTYEIVMCSEITDIMDRNIELDFSGNENTEDSEPTDEKNASNARQDTSELADPTGNETFGKGRTDLMRMRQIQPSPKEISDLIFKRFVEPTRFKNLKSEKIDYYQKVYGRLLRHKKQIAKHVALGLEHKIPQDTYSNPQSKEGNPIAFYFDYSGSNIPSISMYVGIIGRIMKKNVAIYIGGNDRIETRYRLKVEEPTIDLSELINRRYWKDEDEEKINKEYEITHYAGETVDEVVKKEFVKTIALFTDFDGGEVMMKTAEICKTYWFCTQHRNSGNRPYSGKDKNGALITYGEDLSGLSIIDFKGHFVILDNPIDIVNYLQDNFNDTAYEEKQKCKQTGIDQKTLVLRKTKF